MRAAEQGSAKRGAGAPLAEMRPCSRSWARHGRSHAHLRGQFPRSGAPFPPYDAPRLRGCDRRAAQAAETMKVELAACFTEAA